MISTFLFIQIDTITPNRFAVYVEDLSALILDNLRKVQTN